MRNMYTCVGGPEHGTKVECNEQVGAQVHVFGDSETLYAYVVGSGNELWFIGTSKAQIDPMKIESNYDGC